MNNVILIGRLTKEPELKYVGENQIPVIDLIVAVERNYKDVENNTDFISVQAWEKIAQNCAKYLKKGSLVGINGQIRVEKYKNKNDENRYITKVRASKVEFLETKKIGNEANKYYDSSELFEKTVSDVSEKNMELPF